MTTDVRDKAGDRAGAVAAGKDGQRLRADDRRTTTVPVIPLWDRPRTGARG